MGVTHGTNPLPLTFGLWVDNTTIDSLRPLLYLQEGQERNKGSCCSHVSGRMTRDSRSVSAHACVCVCLFRAESPCLHVLNAVGFGEVQDLISDTQKQGLWGGW